MGKIEKLLDSIDMERVSEVVVFANTPVYLYNNIRKLEDILAISDRYEPSYLIKSFEDLMAIDKIEDFNYYLLIYAIIGSLTYKMSDEVNVFFKHIKTMRVRWFKELADIYLASAKYTSYSGIYPDNEIVFPYETQSSGSVITRRTINPEKCDLPLKFTDNAYGITQEYKEINLNR